VFAPFLLITLIPTHRDYPYSFTAGSLSILLIPINRERVPIRCSVLPSGNYLRASGPFEVYGFSQRFGIIQVILNLVYLCGKLYTSDN